MLCLSVRQPWADLLIYGYKPIENRTWKDERRGRFLIHAAKTYDENHGLARRLLPPDKRYLLNDARYRTGGLLGEAHLMRIVKRSRSPWFVGPYGFVIAQPRPFAGVIAYRGQLGFFDVPDAFLEHMRRASPGLF